MRRFVFGAVVAVVTTIGLGGGQTAQGQTKDEQEIRALEVKFAMAFEAKDVDAIMKVYAPEDELFVFDLIPPRDYKGWDAYKKDWQTTFVACMKDTIKFDTQRGGHQGGCDDRRGATASSMLSGPTRMARRLK